MHADARAAGGGAATVGFMNLALSDFLDGSFVAISSKIDLDVTFYLAYFDTE